MHSCSIDSVLRGNLLIVRGRVMKYSVWGVSSCSGHIENNDLCVSESGSVCQVIAKTNLVSDSDHFMHVAFGWPDFYKCLFPVKTEDTSCS